MAKCSDHDESDGALFPKLENEKKEGGETEEGRHEKFTRKMTRTAHDEGQIKTQLRSPTTILNLRPPKGLWQGGRSLLRAELR